MIAAARLLKASPVATAAQPSSLHGSPDGIIGPGIDAGARALGVWLDALLDLIGGASDSRRLPALVAQAKRLPGIEAFAGELAERAIHGAALGMLDVAWELETERPVQVERFRDEEAGGFAGQPYGAAIEQFTKRMPVTRDVWDTLTRLERDRAFTVAGAAQDVVVRKVQHEIQRQLEGGADLRDFRAAVAKRLEVAGFTPQNPSHVETIFRTNVLGAYSRGRITEMAQPDVVALFPYWQVLTANDGPPRQRPNHRAAHGWVVRADDPYWREHGGPPWDYNCRCRLRSLTRKKGEAGAVRGGDELRALGLPAPGFRGAVVSVPVTVQGAPPRAGSPASAQGPALPPLPQPKGERAPYKRPSGLPAVVYEKTDAGFTRPTPRPFAHPSEQPKPYDAAARKALGQYLLDDVTELADAAHARRAARPAAQRATRLKLRELLAEHGFGKVDKLGGELKVGKLRDRGYALGTMQIGGRDAGKMSLRKDVARGAANALAAMNEGNMPPTAQLSNLRTLLHEELHGASRIEPKVYRGAGIVLEEGLTELAARRIANSIAGADVLPALGDGSYLPFRRAIVDLVEKAYREAGLHLSNAEVLDRIHHATRILRSGALPMIESTVQYADRFAEQLQGLPQASRFVLSQRLQGLS